MASIPNYSSSTVKGYLQAIIFFALVLAYMILITQYMILLLVKPPNCSSGLDEENYAPVTKVVNSTSVRVICVILTGPHSHRTKSIHVKKTWGQRCTRLLFVSTQEDEELGTVVIEGAKEGRDWLWAKTRGAMKYIWEHHKEEADWILKADDNTYVIMENLRHFLVDKDPNDPHYYGCRMRWYLQQGVHFGGAGYVLSRESLRRFMDVYSDPTKCRTKHHGDEDGEIGKCLASVGVSTGDSRDERGRHRFLYSRPEVYLLRDTALRMRLIGHSDDLYDPLGPGYECCSKMLIAYHEMSPEKMYFYEYLLYHIKRDP